MIGKTIKYIQSNKYWAVLIASIWTALILFACFIPGNSVPKVNVPLIDKWVHFIIFGGFSFWWYLVWKKVSFFKSLTLFFATALLGYGVELIQGSHLVHNRSYEFNDVVADTIGGIIGILLYIYFDRKHLNN